MARPVQLPARARAARQLPGARLRPAVLAALRALRRRARLEPLHAARVRRRRRRRVRVAARARAAARRRARGRPRVRARAVPSRAEHRAPARPDLALPAARAALRRAPQARCSPPRRSPRSRSPGRSASRSARSRSSSPTRSSAAAGCGDALPGTVGAVVAAELVQHFVIHGSTARGRPVAERGRPLLRRLGRVRLEARARRDARLPRLAHAAPRARRPRRARAVAPRTACAALLGAGVVVPVVVALGTNLPTYRLARHVVPHLKVARVPERLLPITCLALAALLAFAVASWPSDKVSQGRIGIVATAVLLALVAADLHVHVYHAAAADEGNAAYAALRGVAGRAPARAARLPAGRPARERLPLLRDDGAAAAARRLLDDRAAHRRHDRAPTAEAELRRLVARRRAARHPCDHAARRLLRDRACRFRAARTLRRHGFRRVAADGEILVWTRPVESTRDIRFTVGMTHPTAAGAQHRGAEDQDVLRMARHHRADRRARSRRSLPREDELVPGLQDDPRARRDPLARRRRPHHAPRLEGAAREGQHPAPPDRASRPSGRARASSSPPRSWWWRWASC